MKQVYYILLFFLFISVNACNPINPETGGDDNPDTPESIPQEEIPFPTTGEHNYLIVLVETSDVQFSIENPQRAFDDMLNKEGYSDFGGTGSARDYFIAQSNQAFKPKFDVYGPVTVDMAMSSFTTGQGLTKLGAARLFAMACDKLDATIDFSKYDTDNNGVIDNVFFYYAGYNSAEGPDDAIWPHAGQVEYKKWEFDGKQLLDYACTSELRGASGKEMARIGNFCHEFAHILGLPDFYDTERHSDAGPWDFSLMHNGCYNNTSNTPPSLNCEERKLLGWIDAIQEMDSPVTGFELKPVSENCGIILPTDNPGEYFYIEYRNGEGWDEYLPKGLVIYHVDKSENMVDGKTAEFRWRRLYNINGFAEHPCFDLIKASEDCIVFGNGINEYYPFCWDGTETDFHIERINFGEKTVTFDIVGK